MSNSTLQTSFQGRNVLVGVLVLFALVSLFASPALTQERWGPPEGEWEQKFPSMSPPDPDANWGPQMAYFGKTGQVILFNFDDFGEGTGATWAWDGTNWTQIITAHTPPARERGAMVYDSTREVLVLFGGTLHFSPFTQFDDTWEFDGSDWIEINTANSPPPMSDHEMVYDNSRSVSVLFGGAVDPYYLLPYSDETWEYDGTDWNQVPTPISPSGQIDQMMVYDSHRQVTALFGPLDTETWEYTGTWTQKTPIISPSERGAPFAAYHSAVGKVMFFGGVFVWFDGQWHWEIYDEMWEWDGINWNQLYPLNSPPPNCEGKMVYDAIRDRLVLFGGLYNDTWEYRSLRLFTRGKGAPIMETIEWESYGGTGTLTVYNGGLGDNSSARVSSGVIFLNGNQIIGPKDLKSKVDQITVPVHLIEGYNVLGIELRGKPGGIIRIEFTQQ